MFYFYFLMQFCCMKVCMKEVHAYCVYFLAYICIYVYSSVGQEMSCVSSIDFPNLLGNVITFLRKNDHITFNTLFVLVITCALRFLGHVQSVTLELHTLKFFLTF